jgi:hypothetical protein
VCSPQSMKVTFLCSTISNEQAHLPSGVAHQLLHVVLGCIIRKRAMQDGKCGCGIRPGSERSVDISRTVACRLEHYAAARGCDGVEAGADWPESKRNATILKRGVLIHALYGHYPNKRNLKSRLGCEASVTYNIL